RAALRRQVELATLNIWVPAAARVSVRVGNLLAETLLAARHLAVCRLGFSPSTMHYITKYSGYPLGRQSAGTHEMRCMHGDDVYIDNSRGRLYSSGGEAPNLVRPRSVVE